MLFNNSGLLRLASCSGFSSTGLFIVLLTICVLVIVIAVMKGKKRVEKLQSSGRIVKRELYFFECADYFTTTADYKSVRDSVGSMDIAECKAEIQRDVGGKAVIFFKSAHQWNGSIEFLGTQNGKNLFRFYFPEWKTMRYGTPYDVASMNVMTTAVEKLFLRLDPSATVETRRLNYKSK